jgi:putative ABC transport system permease protein
VLYKDEDNLSKLSFVFTLLILFIAALGLLGLSSFMAEQRTQEIGVRKVLGASTGQIIRTMTREFVYLVSIASLLAWSISWLIMDDWLNRFPYQTGINWVVFLLATTLAFSIALGIASLRALLAARMNPAITLKYE